MEKRLHASNELAYLERYQGKQFKVIIEQRIFKNIYTLGDYNQETQMVAVTWNSSDKYSLGETDYKLGQVLTNLTLNTWIIIPQKDRELLNKLK